MCILQTTIQQCQNVELIRKVATKFLESPNEDSLDVTEKLYRTITSVENPSIKLLLYDLIVDYSRSHGIMPYIAKGMYQKYLIERDDFSRLKETYYSGKYVLHYVDFLSQHDRIELYYKLGIHSLQYKQFDYPHIRENTFLMETFINAKKGNIEQSVEQLHLFLKSCSNDSVISATNQLLRLHLQRNNLKDARDLLNTSKIDPTGINKSNPLIYARYAEYLQIKGEYYLAVGDYETCITNMVESASWYSKVNDTFHERSSHLIMRMVMEK
ncbi:hypothetical protein PPOP_3713, partial [Paenibacillus popilliae ATCC 14706]